MSEFKVSSIENTSNGSPSFSQGLNIAGADITASHAISEYYTGATEPTSPKNGAFWWDGTNLHQYINTKFRILSVTPPPTYYGDRGIFGAGFKSFVGYSNVIDYVTISSAGNATDFGDITTARSTFGSCSSGSRGLFAGGNSGSGNFNIIDYITIASTGNATDFGDLTVTRNNVTGCCSNGVRGLFGPGGSAYSSDANNLIDYVTIATTGNAVDFGDVSVARVNCAGCASGEGRGVFGGGQNSSGAKSNIIDYVTIATTGNATDFGDLTQVRDSFTATSSETIGVFFGGYTDSYFQNTIDYITIASPGNATDFGDLTAARYGMAASANGTRGIVGGDNANFGDTTIEYVTIANPGNAVDFGDLSAGRYNLAACSGD
tara:strand:- start:429 stop:1556 length:1128 start_codon:yes stop_codon:yes gene_type:complete